MAHTTKPDIAQLLRRINEGATNSQTPLGDVLRLCMRLGRLLNNKELSDWAKVESGGYEDTDSLPDYRIFQAGVRGTFSGPYGSSIENAPIPQSFIEQQHHDLLFKVYVRQSVGELERIVSRSGDNDSITIPWSGDTIRYYQQREIYKGYVLVSAQKMLTGTAIAGVLEVIRARVFEFAFVIETEFGIDAMNDDDKKPLEVLGQEKVAQTFNMTILGGTNIAVGNPGTTNQYVTHVQPGDLQGLREKLGQLGVTAELLDDLDTALGEDADAQEQPGPHVQGWFGRLMIKAGQGTIQLASAAATTIVMTEVRRFLGLPPA